MFRRCSIAIAFLAWACALGWQWPTLQVAVWIKMAADYHSVIGWGPAIQFAVTGPKCPLCHAIAQGRSESRDKDNPAAVGDDDLRIVLVPPGTPWRVIAPSEGDRTPGQHPVVPRRGRDRPPVPPPRFAGV